MGEKTSALEAEAFKTKRLQEESAILKRKVERLKKIEMASDMDEILKEEIREYKVSLDWYLFRFSQYYINLLCLLLSEAVILFVKLIVEHESVFSSKL